MRLPRLAVAAVLLACELPIGAAAATFSVTSTEASGPGSLAGAITAANAVPYSKIVFNLQGTPPYTIDLVDALPPVNPTVTIDATTQPGFSGNPVVTLVSNLAAPALQIGSHSTVVGLAFRLSAGPGIVGSGEGVLVGSCRFDRNGAPSDIETSAIRFVNSMGSEVIGCTAGFGSGVEVINSSGVAIDACTFNGCYGSAIAVKRSSKVSIGSVEPVVIESSIAADQPAISVDATSTAGIRNVTIAHTAMGIDLAGNQNRITSSTIHDTAAWAIRISGQQNWIDGDSIYNVGAGATNGIVLVDGGNSNIPPPTISAVDVTPAGTTIKATMNAQSSNSLGVAFYESDTCDVPVGQTPLGEISTRDPSIVMALPPIAPGTYVTAIQIRSLSPSGQPVETSAFSACFRATGSAAGPAPSITSVDNILAFPGGTARIAGANMATFARIFFGQNQASCGITASNATCTVPAGSGTVDVSIVNPDGQRAVAAAAFTYVNPCAEIWLNSTSGDAGTNGAPVTLSAVVSSDAQPLTYQWYTGQGSSAGTAISGETRPTITVPAPRNRTPYRLRTTNSCGSHVDATMMVYPCPSGFLVITQQPANVSAPAGKNATLSVNYYGGPATIQWYEGVAGDTSHPLVPGNGLSLTVPVVKPTSYWARLTTVCGSVDTQVALVTPTRHRAARP